MAGNKTSLLCDTHLLVWFASDAPRLTSAARSLVSDPGIQLYFSLVSIWEVAIKTSIGRASFQVNADQLRHALLARDWVEIGIGAAHVIATGQLPFLHRDPFDRMLVAQAQVEDLTLATVDRKLAGYAVSTLYVG